MYLNRSTNTLFYKARPNENMSTISVVAPLTETLVKIAGDSLGAPIHDIWMQGITFAHSTYLRPSDSGFLIVQAGNTAFRPPIKNMVILEDRPRVSMSRARTIYVSSEILSGNWLQQPWFAFWDSWWPYYWNQFSDIGGNGISVAKFCQDGNTWTHFL